MMQGVSRDEEVLLRFSLKESLYKAMHPLIGQFVGFQEVQVQPFANGTALVDFFLHSGAHQRFGAVTAHWRREGRYFVSSASVRLRNDEQPVEDGCDVSAAAAATAAPSTTAHW